MCQQCGQTMDVALYKMDLSGGQDDRMETIEYSCPQCGAATGPHFPDSLEAIQAAPENPHFYSRDGLLYSGKTLCCCPPGMRREEIAVLEGTETILSHAFYDCDLIRRATLPDSVKTIESVAWFSCGKLQSVRLPAGAETIQPSAFSFCWRIKSLVLPEGNPRYTCDDGMLVDKETLTLLLCVSDGEETLYTVPDGIQRIGSGAFTCLSAMRQVKLPDSVTAIEDGAFSFSNVTEIHLPSAVASLGEEAFSGCEKLVSIDLPDSISRVGQGCFRFCEGLKEAQLPAGLKKLEDNMFVSCEALESVTLPEALEEIGELAFYSCTSLSALHLPSALRSIGNEAFAYCESLREITIPGSVSSIGDSAFYGCENLSKATALEGANGLGNMMFGSCKALKILVLPASVTLDAQADRRLAWDADGLTVIAPEGSSAMAYCRDLSILCVTAAQWGLIQRDWQAVDSDDSEVKRLLESGGRVLFHFEKEKFTMRAIHPDGTEEGADYSCVLQDGQLLLNHGRLSWALDKEDALSLQALTWRMTLIPWEEQQP